MIVPAGGTSLDGTRWVPCRPGFFLPVRVLSRLFRRLFLAGLVDAHAVGRLVFFDRLEGLRRREAFAAHLAPLRRKKWFLYVKPPPCADPEAVLAYLARYTHRVAISNSRLLGLDERGVTFPLQGLPPRRPGAVAHHDARPRRVHQALPAPRPAKGVPPHPSLRAARQRHLQEEYRACQRTDRHARAGDRSAGGARRGGPSRRRRSRPSPAMPLLRWPHDYRRDLRARRCTPRPAVARYRGQDRDAMTPRHRLIAPPTSRQTSPPASRHY